MMTASCRWLAATVALAALAGCDQGQQERAQAAGEILEGTTSDAMLRTDQVRSEAPLAPRTAKGKADASAKTRDPQDPAARDAEDPPAATDAAVPAEPPSVPPAVETPETD